MSFIDNSVEDYFIEKGVINFLIEDCITPCDLDWIDDFLDELPLSEGLADHFNSLNTAEKGNFLRAWNVAFQHDDLLRRDVPFLSKLSNDLNNPNFPNGSSANVSQVRAALNNQNIFEFYKKFATTPYMSNSMRKRYLEVITLSDAVSRFSLLENILLKREIFYNFVKLNYGTSLAEDLLPKNFLYGTATYIIDGVEQPPINFFSISWTEPSSTILVDNPVIPFDDMGDVSRILVGNPEDAFVSGNYDSTLRFFMPTGNLPHIRQWDTEAKSIEIIIEKIAEQRSIAVGDRSSDNLNEILQNTDLQISLNSEMSPCSSCNGIIEQFNSLAPSGTMVLIEGGTLYHN